MLKLIKAQVASNIDPLTNGSFEVTCELFSGPKDVIYTSPMFRVGGGGFFAAPKVGDQVFIIHDDGSDKLYYHSTVVEVPEGNPVDIKGWEEVPQSNYDSKYQPTRVRYEDYFGQGLSITRQNENAEEITPSINSSVDLHSELGKKVTLNDSPEVEAVILRNQHGEGITIQGDANKITAAGTIKASSNGPHYYTTHNSFIEMRVVDGQDITIENNSTGGMGQTPSPEYWPNNSNVPGGDQPPKMWGGIYLRSENGDVSISSNSDRGRIFITTPGAKIQIVTRGPEEAPFSDIRVKCNGNLSIDSDGDIDMQAGGNFRVRAANVDIGSEGHLITEAGGRGSISSGGDMTIDGSTIDLNSGNSEPAADPVVDDPLLNDYSE